MEDLIPFLIFVVIAVINLLKFAAEKGGRKPPAPSPDKPSNGRDVTGIEKFIDELAGRLEPQPAEPPVAAAETTVPPEATTAAPEEVERPDLMQAAAEIEAAGREVYEQEDMAKVIPMPQRETEAPASPGTVDVPDTRYMDQKKSLQAVMKAMPAMICDTRGMRITSSPFQRSHGAHGISFSLKGKGALRKAILANLIFSPPRAYDTSFDNSIMNKPDNPQML